MQGNAYRFPAVEGDTHAQFGNLFEVSLDLPSKESTSSLKGEVKQYLLSTRPDFHDFASDIHWPPGLLGDRSAMAVGNKSKQLFNILGSNNVTISTSNCLRFAHPAEATGDRKLGDLEALLRSALLTCGGLQISNSTAQ